MASLTPTSVVSAAIISGDLIIGLSDGSVINCGRCQGPQGLDGPQGAIGSTGRPGQDGNTILTAEGTPRPDLGVVGDYVIDKTRWNIYGPKSSGGWGSPTPLRGNGKGAAATRRDLSEGVPTTGEGGSGGGGIIYNTSNLSLTGFGRALKASVNVPGGNIIPKGDNLKVQANLNRWVYDSLAALDSALPVKSGDVLPQKGEYKGDLFLKDGILNVWDGTFWVEVGGGGGGDGTCKAIVSTEQPEGTPQEGELWFDSSTDTMELFTYVDGHWVSATPNSEYALEERIAANEEGIRELNTDQLRQDYEIAGLDTRVDQLEGKVGEYTYTLQTANVTPRDGQMVLLKGDLSTTTRWEDAEHISFNPTTLSGEIFDISEVVTGDVIRLFVQGDITMQLSAFEVKVIQNGEPGGGILSISQTIKAVGTGMDGAAYEVEHLSSFDPSGLATMNYVDAQDAAVKAHSDAEDEALRSYVEEQDALKLNLTGGKLTGPLSYKVGAASTAAYKIVNQNNDDVALKVWCPGGAGTEIKYVGNNNTSHWFQLYDEEDKNPVTPARFAYQEYSLTAKADITYRASDAHYFKGAIHSDKTLIFARGTDKLQQFKISPNSGDNYATNIYALNGGQMRFRTSHTNEESDNVGSHIILDSVGGTPETKIYNVVTPTNPSMAANKAYVDAQTGGGGVPIGCIMMWLAQYAPDGWLICDGSSFDITEYPELHTHLQTIYNNSTGKTPDFTGLYPGGAGTGHNNNLSSGSSARPNVYFSQRTAQPNGGPPKSTSSIPDGTVRTFTATGGTNAYSNGVAKVSISEGWDAVTRPPTLSVHFIIKAV